MRGDNHQSLSIYSNNNGSRSSSSNDSNHEMVLISNILHRNIGIGESLAGNDNISNNSTASDVPNAYNQSSDSRKTDPKSNNRPHDVKKTKKSFGKYELVRINTEEDDYFDDERVDFDDNNSSPRSVRLQNDHNHSRNYEIVNTTLSLKDQKTQKENERSLRFATNASWIVNWFLLFFKIIAFSVSLSKAVAAALADSVVDLVSQAILSLSERYMSKHNPDYPIGRSRLEAVSVLATASIMSMASIEIIQYSVIDLYNGLSGTIFHLTTSGLMYSILGIGIAMKLILYLYCRWVNNTVIKSDSLEALAEDHLNDVLSNFAAALTAFIATFRPHLWWVDPAGAVFISLIIMYRWYIIIDDQIKKIVGYTAPNHFIDQVTAVASDHDSRLDVISCRAYHFGCRYIVELEIMLPPDMTVKESYAISSAVHHKIEHLNEVERAFVHVVHDKKNRFKHKRGQVHDCSTSSNTAVVGDEKSINMTTIDAEDSDALAIAEEGLSREISSD